MSETDTTEMTASTEEIDGISDQFFPCPECGEQAERFGTEQQLPQHWATCSEFDCDWSQKAEIRDTGAAVQTRSHQRPTVGEIRRWYRKNGFEDRANWIRSLLLQWKFADSRLVDKNDHGIGFAKPDQDPLQAPEVRNHRNGLAFDRELRDLKPVAKRLLQPHIGGEVILEEVRYGPKGCHTDLVFVEVDLDELAKRLSIASRTPLNSDTKRIYGYWSIRRGSPYSKPGFLKHGKYVESTSKQVWNWLSDNGWIATNDSGWGTVVPYHQFCTTHAVELKLRNWSKALDQARRADGSEFDDRKAEDDYWGYADYQWVALDAGAAHKAVNQQDRFEDAGVGLFSVSDGVAHKHVDAARTGFDGPTRDRVWLEETVLRRLNEEQPDLVDEAATRHTESMPSQPELGMFTRGES